MRLIAVPSVSLKEELPLKTSCSRTSWSQAAQQLKLVCTDHFASRGSQQQPQRSRAQQYCITCNILHMNQSFIPRQREYERVKAQPPMSNFCRNGRTAVIPLHGRVQGLLDVSVPSMKAMLLTVIYPTGSAYSYAGITRRNDA